MSTTAQDIQASIGKIEEAEDIIKEEWARIEYMLSLSKGKKLQVKVPTTTELTKDQWLYYQDVLGVDFID